MALGATSQVARQEDSTTLRVTWLQASVVALMARSSVRATVVATMYEARRSGGADPVVTQPKMNLPDEMVWWAMSSNQHACMCVCRYSEEFAHVFRNAKSASQHLLAYTGGIADHFCDVAGGTHA